MFKPVNLHRVGSYIARRSWFQIFKKRKTAFPTVKNNVFDRKITFFAIDNNIFCGTRSSFENRKRCRQSSFNQCVRYCRMPVWYDNVKRFLFLINLSILSCRQIVDLESIKNGVWLTKTYNFIRPYRTNCPCDVTNPREVTRRYRNQGR